MTIQAIMRVVGTVSSGDWLGWMFAMAIILGGVLDNKGRDLLGWCISVVIYAAFNLAVANTYMNVLAATKGHPAVIISIDSVIFVMITLSVYCAGLTIGWSVVWFTKHRSHVNYIAKRLKEADNANPDTTIEGE